MIRRWLRNWLAVPECANCNCETFSSGYHERVRNLQAHTNTLDERVRNVETYVGLLAEKQNVYMDKEPARYVLKRLPPKKS